MSEEREAAPKAEAAASARFKHARDLITSTGAGPAPGSACADGAGVRAGSCARAGGGDIEEWSQILFCACEVGGPGLLPGVLTGALAHNRSAGILSTCA